MKSAKRKAAAAAPAPAPREPSYPWILWSALAAGLLLAALVYSAALRGPFVFDDMYLPMFYHPGRLLDWLAGVRPVLMFSYWLTFRGSELDPAAYHLTNFLLHALTSVLVYKIVRRLLELAGSPPDARSRLLSLFSAGVFLLHPVQTESVAYVASRSETLSVFFYYAAYAAFLYRRRAAATFRVTAAIILLFALALFTKEHAATLPLLLVLTDYYWNPRFSFGGIKRNWRLYVPIAAAGALGIKWIGKVLAGASTAGFGMRDITPWRYLLSQSRALWVYLRLYLLPFGLNIDHNFPLSRSLWDHGAIWAMAALAVLIAFAWIWRKRAPLASFGLFVFLLLIAPTSSAMPIKDLLVEHRMYLPMLGLLLITADLLRRPRLSLAALAGSGAAVLLVLAALTQHRVQVWSSDIALWQDSVRKSPENVRARFQLAAALYEANRCQESADEYARVAALSQFDGLRLAVNRALALDCTGDFNAAVAVLDSALATQRSTELFATLGMIYGKQGFADRALAALDQAAAIDPNYEMTHVYRGNVYMTLGNYMSAAEAYRKALRINPNQSAALTPLIEAERRLAAKPAP